MKLGILGGGRAAWAFGSAWQMLGWPISGVWLRPESSSRIAERLEARARSIEELADDSDLLLIAVTDRAVAEVAGRIPETRAIIFHASGALTSVRGGFSLHPLKALPPVGEPSALTDTLLVFEGAHREVAEEIARGVGARFAAVTAAEKTLYHAAAVFGSNYVAAVLDIAHSAMKSAGIGDIRDDLVRLAQSAIENWQRHDGPARFTGPAARGDRQVVQAHLRALAAADPAAGSIYALLADRIAGQKLATDE